MTHCEWLEEHGFINIKESAILSATPFAFKITFLIAELDKLACELKLDVIIPTIKVVNINVI